MTNNDQPYTPPISPDDADYINNNGIIPLAIAMEIGASAVDFYVAAEAHLDRENKYIAVTLTGHFVRCLTEHFLSVRMIQAQQAGDDKQP